MDMKPSPNTRAADDSDSDVLSVRVETNKSRPGTAASRPFSAMSSRPRSAATTKGIYEENADISQPQLLSRIETFLSDEFKQFESHKQWAFLGCSVWCLTGLATARLTQEKTDCKCIVKFLVRFAIQGTIGSSLCRNVHKQLQNVSTHFKRHQEGVRALYSQPKEETKWDRYVLRLILAKSDRKSGPLEKQIAAYEFNFDKNMRQKEAEFVIREGKYLWVHLSFMAVFIRQRRDCKFEKRSGRIIR